MDMQPSFDGIKSELGSYLCRRFGYKTACLHGRYPTLQIRRAKARLALEFMPGGGWPERTLVIAAISFQKTRTGNGRAVLAKLAELCAAHGYTSIGIVQPCADAGFEHFVHRFGFARHQYDGRWLVSVQSLLTSVSAGRGVSYIPTT